jgi:hypothetical protein
LIQKVRNVVSKIKELWGFPVFRWFIYQSILSGFAFIAVEERLLPMNRGDTEVVVFFFHPIPPLWVWRKPIWKCIRKLFSFLNRLAGED